MVTKLYDVRRHFNDVWNTLGAFYATKRDIRHLLGMNAINL